MGNRANVIFAHEGEIGPAVYLHWNGGPESVYAFLAEMETRGFNRERGPDVQYATARFVQVVADLFGIEHMLSLGVSNGPASLDDKEMERFNPGDNGVFVVGWERVADVTRFTVRRFVTADSWRTLPVEQWTARELTPEEVAAERREAERSNYMTGSASLPKWFDRFRKARAKLNAA